ncbi:uncharacterized protein LOC131302829 [Rhododendron vialii]|uniref:uncharacterized protein LOC131302829 n=1 Tax=Rhododendron vialii TaxID=182163 RepID=UPI00265DE3CD|nr:uncharacterized protein LOC131302829 [Rhododendron vialii]
MPGSGHREGRLMRIPRFCRSRLEIRVKMEYNLHPASFTNCRNPSCPSVYPNQSLNSSACPGGSFNPGASSTISISQKKVSAQVPKKRGRPVGSKSKSDKGRGLGVQDNSPGPSEETFPSAGSGPRVGEKRRSDPEDNEVCSPAKKPRQTSGVLEGDLDCAIEESNSTNTVEEASREWPQWPNEAVIVELPWTCHQLKSMVQLHSPDFVFLSETKQKPKKLDSVRRSISMNNGFWIDPIGLSGGLGIFWNDSVAFEVLKYVDGIRYQQLIDLSEHVKGLNSDVVVWGDFNDILKPGEKRWGLSRDRGKFCSFSIFS